MTETPWDTRAKEYGTSEIGAHSDAHLVELENEFIERHLKRIEPCSILDVGCGNGQRTKRWAKYANQTYGIDSSHEMISLARQSVDEFERNNDNHILSFFTGNVLHIGKRADDGWDVIISARCLINLPTKQDQINAIDLIYGALKPGGYFICCEGRQEGTRKLNELRKQFGVEPIKVNELNLDLSNDVIDHINTKFHRVDESYLGTYYFITRVLTQIKTMSLEETAKRLQLMYGDYLSTFGMGRHFCFCGRKE